MTAPNDEMAAKIGVDKLTSHQAYAAKHGQYDDKMPVDNTKVSPLPNANPSPFGALK